MVDSIDDHGCDQICSENKSDSTCKVNQRVTLSARRKPGRNQSENWVIQPSILQMNPEYREAIFSYTNNAKKFLEGIDKVVE
jgi:hypothetical protein